MPLPAITDNLESIPEAVRDEYKPSDDGTFVLQVEPANGMELINPAGLKSALQKERGAVAELRKKYSGLDDLLDRADEARDALKRIEELGNDPGNAKEIEQLREQLKTQFDRDRANLDAKYKSESENHTETINTLRGQLQKVMVEDRARAAMAARGVNDVLLPHVVSQLRCVENNGEFGVEVIDSDNPDIGRISPRAGSTGPMSIEELLDEMSGNDKYAVCFPANGTPGSGAGGSGGGSARRAGSTLQITAEQAQDTTQYRLYKEQAEKQGLQLEILE